MFTTRSHRTPRVLAAGLALAGLAPFASAQVQIPIASDSFDYAPGALDGAHGGSGFSTPWIVPSGPDFQVVFPGVDPIGGKLCTLGGSQPLAALRGFDAGSFPDATVGGEFGADGTGVSFSFDIQRPAGSDASFAGVALGGQQTPPLFVGVIPGSSELGVLDTQGNFSSVWTTDIDMPHRVFAHVDFTPTTNGLTMWIDPISEPPTGAPDLVMDTGGNFSFRDIGIFVDGGTDNRLDVDNINLVLVEDEPGCIGTRRCTSTPNSTGAAAEICITGSRAVIDNDVLLTATGVADTAGIFYFGSTQIQIPFGDGFLCTSGTIIRQGVTFGTGNVAQFRVDLTIPKNVNPAACSSTPATR